jgi:erythromycin esterase-like protein
MCCFLLSHYSSAQSKVDFSSIANYQIIAFGEASHGSKSDYQAREELIANLVLHTDSVDVLVEMPYYAGIAIQQYNSGIIDTIALLKELRYYGLSTDAFFHLINRFKSEPRVRFYGIDMQTHQSSLHLLKQTLIASLPDLEERITNYSDSLDHDFFEEYSVEQYLSYSETIRSSLEALSEMISANDSVLKQKFTEVTLPLIVLQQYFGYLDGYKRQTEEQYFDFFYFRDSCMAGNVITIQSHSKKQIVLLAANSHVEKFGTDKSGLLGQRLNWKFQQNYFVIGSQYVRGTILEVGDSNGVRKLIPKTLHPVRRTLPYALNRQLKPAGDTLIIIGLSNKKLNKLFNRRAHYQNFGAGREHHRRAMYKHGIVADLYDAIYLIPVVEASSPISEKNE